MNNKQKTINQEKQSAASKEPADITITYNPASGEETARIEHTDIDTMPQRFEKARRAQQEWANLSFKQRATHILKMREYILDHLDELAEIVSTDNGKTRLAALITEVVPSALACTWYAKNAEETLKPIKLKTSNIMFLNKRSMVIRQPLGVVGIISPWNYPLTIPFGEVVMGLMAGNAIMLKVAAATLNVGRAIENIVAAGELPEGLFQHIIGKGSTVGKAFFENKVDKIFFTGSIPTGKLLMKQASEHLTPLSLELGGKDPMIVMEDADLERAANGAVWGAFQNSGQTCSGIERVYVHESIYDPFIQLLKEKTNKIRHGIDTDFNVEMGAITIEEQLQTIEQHVNEAVEKGAKIIAQSKPSHNGNGRFYPATLMVDVDHSMILMKEETFGPILPVMKYKTIEEAIELANDSSMGLTASVWTRDIKKGIKVAEKVQAGVLTINDHVYTHGLNETPWGGVKESGIGRTHSAFGLEEMTVPKVINWDLLQSKRDPWWFPYDRDNYDAFIMATQFLYPKSLTEWIKAAIKVNRYVINKMFSPWK